MAVGEPGNDEGFANQGKVATARQAASARERFSSCSGRPAAWDGRDRHGRDVAAGVYFVRMASGGFTASGKIAVAR